MQFVQHIQQYQRPNWEDVDCYPISWSDWWCLSSEYLKFLFQSAYDFAASLENLMKWGEQESQSC